MERGSRPPGGLRTSWGNLDPIGAGVRTAAQSSGAGDNPARVHRQQVIGPGTASGRDDRCRGSATGVRPGPALVAGAQSYADHPVQRFLVMENGS